MGQEGFFPSVEASCIIWDLENFVWTGFCVSQMCWGSGGWKGSSFMGTVCPLHNCSVCYHKLLKWRGKPSALRAITAFILCFPVFKTAVVLVYKDGTKQKKKLVRLFLSPTVSKHLPFLSASQLALCDYNSEPVSGLNVLWFFSFFWGVNWAFEEIAHPVGGSHLEHKILG